MKRIGSTRWLGGALVVGAAMWMLPGAANAELVGPLVQCTSVTQPAALTTCAEAGQDPLTSGNVVLDDEGNLNISLVGGGTSTSYSVIFRSIDGNVIQLGTLSTGPLGNGSKSKYAALPFGKDAVGSIVLQRNSGDQYTSSLFVRPAESMSTRASFHADLMGCKAVNDPQAITGCGTDSFKSGSVEVNSDTGAITIQVNGAEAAATYTAVLRAPGGSATLALGTVGPTDSKGDATADTGTVPASTIASGTVVLTRNSADQAYGGVRVTEKQPKRPATGSGLVRCIDVNIPTGDTPSDLGDACGTDPLIAGSAVLSQSGKLTVSLTGAAASTAYEVFFRPIDGAANGSDDQDTKIAITTGTSGSGKGSGSAVTSGQIGAGTFVVKNAGTDEFFGGFSIK
jgi:hypothetical protein